MVKSIAITDTIKTFNDLEAKFNLRQTKNANFFPEWYEDLPFLNDPEKARLEQIRQRYIYHRSGGALLKGTVNILIVSYLLETAGFLEPSFKIRSPESVKITLDDPDEVITGLIDILVVQEQLWILVIESKRTTIPIISALPQILAYMIANPDSQQLIFGLATNGDEFIFIKLVQREYPEYDISDAFLLLPQRNKFDDVLRILKRIGLTV